MTENCNIVKFNSIDLDNLRLKVPVILNNGDKIMYSENFPLIEIGDEKNMKMMSNTMNAHPAIYPQPEKAGEIQYEMIDENVIKFMDKLKYVCIKIKSPEKKPKLKSCKYIILEESENTLVFVTMDDKLIESYELDYDYRQVAIIIQFVGLIITKFGQCKFKFKVRKKILGNTVRESQHYQFARTGRR